MRVAGKQNERMLQDQGRDPHIVRRDRRTLLSQLPVNSAVLMSCLFVGVQHANAGLQEKTTEDGLVARSLSTDGKSCAQFSQHNKGEPDFIGEFDRFDNSLIAPAQVGVAVCVERQPHCHIPSSIVSCAANALSKAASLRQVPAMSLRSRCGWR